MVPAQLEGNAVFVVAFHPTLGMLYHEGAVDTSTLTCVVDWPALEERQALTGILQDADGKPIPSANVTLHSRYLGTNLAEVQTDVRGRFSFLGFGDRPASWAGKNVNADEFSIEACVGKTPLLFKEMISSGSSQTTTKRSAKATVVLGQFNVIQAE